jgi:nicotine blue oxidoreductase
MLRGLTPVPAVVLAAGAGRRFGGEPKLLAELDGRPLLDHVLAAAAAAESVGRVVVVVGARGGDVRPVAERRGAEVVLCEAWSDGQAASLRCGLEAVAGAEKVLLLVGDQPGITAAAIDRMAPQPPGTRAAYGGAPGHPAVLGREEMEQAAALSGDRGLRDVTRWRLVECGDVAEGRDVDTRADLEAARKAKRSRTGGR